MAEIFYSSVLIGRVTVREGNVTRPLNPRLDLRKHSPAGFVRGEDDAGLVQLSLALLADALGDDVRAIQLEHRFADRVVKLFPERWTITRSRVVAYADMIEGQERVVDAATAPAPVGAGDLGQARRSRRA